MPDTEQECLEELDRYQAWLHELLTKLASERVVVEAPDSRANPQETQKERICLVERCRPVADHLASDFG
jgi:hypothetical protein